MAGRHRRKVPLRRRASAWFTLAAVPVLTVLSPTTTATEPPPTVTPPPTTPPPPTPSETTSPIPAPTTTTRPPRPTKKKPRPSYGGVAPHVARVGWLIQEKFGVKTVHGVGPRKRKSDHPRGYALDFMCTRTQGDRIAAYLLDHFDELNLKYVIWKQRINHGNGWRKMPDRGGVTENHFDHVHVSVKRK